MALPRHINLIFRTAFVRQVFTTSLTICCRFLFRSTKTSILAFIFLFSNKTIPFVYYSHFYSQLWKINESLFFNSFIKKNIMSLG